MINYGGEKGIEAILKIYDSAIPIDELPDPLSAQRAAISPVQSDCDEYSVYQYNSITKETSIVDYSDSIIESESGIVEPIIEGNEAYAPIPKTRAWPHNWYETNPDYYHDTRSTCKILVSTRDGSTAASGFLIKGDLLVTAGHCLYNRDFGLDPNNPSNNYFCDSVIVIPCSQSKSPSAPYGIALSRGIMISRGWGDTFDSNKDWGTVDLDRSFTTGTLGRMLVGDNINGWWVRSQGYPAASDDMYLVGGNITSTTEKKITMNNQTLTGVSGGPILDGSNYVIGITIQSGGGETVGVKMDATLFETLRIMAS